MAKAFKRFLSWNYKIKKSSGISRAVQAQGKKKHCLVLAVSYKLAKGTGIEEADARGLKTKLSHRRRNPKILTKKLDKIV